MYAQRKAQYLSCDECNFHLQWLIFWSYPPQMGVLLVWNKIIALDYNDAVQ